MKYVTLEDIQKEVQEVEKRISEPVEVGWQIRCAAAEISRVAHEGKPIKIITDYDADGICFGYIMDKTLHKLNPDVNLEVICNDRRNPYGIPKDLKAEPDTTYIIGDMGSNELDYIHKTFGDTAFVLDHHLITSEQDRDSFNSNRRLLNPHSIVLDDGQSAEYCATGLAYRVYQEIEKEYTRYVKHMEKSDECVAKLRGALQNHTGNIMDFAKMCSDQDIMVDVDSETKTLIDNINDPHSPATEYAVCDVFTKSGEYLFQAEIALNKEKEAHSTEQRTIDKAKGIGNINFSVIDMDNRNRVFHDIPPTTLNKQTGKINRHFSSTQSFDDKFKNTIDIFAGIGTISDMVNVLDEHSNNRAIIKNAMEKIDNADETNIDYVLGRMLKKVGISQEEITAKRIAFKVGAYLNSASRMSEVIEQNGAQLMYNTIAGEDHDEAFVGIADMYQLHLERKELINNAKNEAYYNFIDSQRFGEQENDKVAVYVVEDNIPAATCGLIAAQITDAVNKPAIVLTSHLDKQTGQVVYSGSGRNIPNMESLHDYLSCTQNVDGLEIKYGGHHDAVGISYINDVTLFKQVILEHQQELKEKPVEEVRLAISPAEINSPETLEKVKALEPLGTGLKLPPVELEGKEQRRSQYFKSGNKHWKDVMIDGVGKVTDWSYSPDCYPTDKSNIIKMLAELEINDYNGNHIQATAKYDKDIILERRKEIERAAKKTAPTKTD